MSGISLVSGAPLVTGQSWQSSAGLPNRSPVTLSFGADRFSRRKTGIVATIGPASNNPQTIRSMIMAGTGVFRLNFAKGDHNALGETIDRIRDVASQLRKSGKINRPVRIMADLQGPRIAVGKMSRQMTLTRDQHVALGPDDAVNTPGVIPTTYPELVTSLQPGNRVIINDGRIMLEVVEPASFSPDGLVDCRVIKGGALESGALINAPDAPLDTPALTQKDKADLAFALSKDVEIITQSYPGSAKDVLEARRMIEAAGKHPMLVAKIERPRTVEPDVLAAITQVADAVMVARGDLATEAGLFLLPKLQQRIMAEAHRQGKPVIVANKLLDSMAASDQPNRSDVFDVAQAVENGADWLMLTAETASGQHPVQAVEAAAALIDLYQDKPAETLAESLRRWLYRQVDRLVERLQAWLSTIKRPGSGRIAA